MVDGGGDVDDDDFEGFSVQGSADSLLNCNNYWSVEFCIMVLFAKEILFYFGEWKGQLCYMLQIECDDFIDRKNVSG